MSSLQHASPHAPQAHQSSLSFTQGFLLGQLSVVLLIGAFLKFFIFGEAPSHETTASARALARKNAISHAATPSLLSSPAKKARSSSHVLRPPPRLTTSTILSKTYYNVNSHPPESLDWFNVLIAQTIAQFRTDAHDDDAILTSLTTLLNGGQKPSFLSSIKVTEISLGEEFPILSNCRVHPVTTPSASAGETQLQARMDVDLSDFITLGIETKIVLNYPKPGTAILPISLAVSIVRFSGTLSISFLPSSSSSPPTNTTTASSSDPNSPNHTTPSQPPSTTPTTLAFSFLPDYRLDLSVRSLVGSRSRLQDIPKIAQLVESRLHAWIDERCVEPRVQQVVLPSFWPRKAHTRGPGGSESGGGDPQAERGDGKAAGEDYDIRRSEGEGYASTVGLKGVKQDSRGFEEGLRIRKEFSMPGSIPGDDMWG